MRVLLSRGGRPPRLLADLPRRGADELASMALLVDDDVDNARVLDLLADELDPAELEQARHALALDQGGAT